MSGKVDSRPVEIAPGIFHLRVREEENQLATNAYLVTDGGEAVLIDGGGRSHFSAVMLSLLQAGVTPDRVTAMILHHYDPDLCGAVYNFESALPHPGLKVISHRANHQFLRYYGTRLPMASLQECGHRHVFPGGRELRFIETPFAHAPGSFVTFDPRTGTLFSSDLFGSDRFHDDNAYRLEDKCFACGLDRDCADGCYPRDVVRFHNVTMPSSRALTDALANIEKLPLKLIAPQHGSLLRGEQDCRRMLQFLRTHAQVGHVTTPG